jgi:MFS family permease
MCVLVAWAGYRDMAAIGCEGNSMSAQAAELDPRRWWALPVVLTGSFLSFLDFFIINIALPAMRDDLGARPSQLQFVVAGYGIGFAVSLITGGRLGDSYGRKGVFLLGIAGFTLASALCGLVVNPTMLIASRVLQAVMAATLTPQVLAIIRVEFALHERPFAIGLYGTSMGFASVVAQLLGGLLVPLFLIYGLGQGLAQPALINIVVGSSGVSGEDAGSAAGLFLTTAQSSIALGVAAIGDVFFSRLGDMPAPTDYFAALSDTLSWNLVLQVATFLLVLLLPMLGRRAARPVAGRVM